MNNHKPQWAYFALLRPQNESLSWVKEAVRKDGGRNAPTDEQIEEYCRLHNIRRPIENWWDK